MKQFNYKVWRWRAGLIVFIMLLAVQALFMFSRTSASPLTNTELRLNRLSAGQATAFRVIFKAASSQTANLSIDFNGTDSGTSQWTNATPGGLVNTTQTVATAQCVTDGYTALPGGSLTAAGSGGVVTVSGVGATTSGQTYCVDLTSASAVTNPTVAAQYHPTISIGTDSKTVAVDIISSNTDQITVSAQVNPSFTFSLTSNSATLNPVTTSGTSATAINATISTNASAGWQVWARDSASSGPYGLASATAGHTIQYSPAAGSAASALTTGGSVEGYNMGVSSVTGTCNGSTTYASGYDNTANTSLKGGGLDNVLRSLATGGGTASSCALPMTFNAVASNTTPAATDYSDTVFVVGAGLF